MSSKPTIQESGKVTIYLPKEDWDYVLENYEMISGSEESLPWGKFFMKAMAAAMATRRPDSSPEDKARINELIGNVDTLTLSNDEMKLQIAELTEKNTLLKEQVYNSGNTKTQSESIIAEQKIKLQNQNTTIENMSNEIAILRNDSGAIPEGSVLVNLTPKTLAVINEICRLESERMEQEVTPDLLFKNVFFFVIKNGPHDMFKVPISVQRIREISDAINNV